MYLLCSIYSCCHKKHDLVKHIAQDDRLEANDNATESQPVDLQPGLPVVARAANYLCACGCVGCEIFMSPAHRVSALRVLFC